jgi:hypothetical protein
MVVQPISIPPDYCKRILCDWIQGFKLVGIREEKVDRRRIMGSINTLIFSIKDFRIDIRSVEEE